MQCLALVVKRKHSCPRSTRIHGRLKRAKLPRNVLVKLLKGRMSARWFTHTVKELGMPDPDPKAPLVYVVSHGEDKRFPKVFVDPPVNLKEVVAFLRDCAPPS